MASDKDKKSGRRPISSPGAKKKQTPVKNFTDRISEIFKNAVFHMCLVLSLAVITVFLAFPMPEAYNLSLLLGDIADQDIKAARDLDVLDKAATSEKRETARRNSPLVFDLNDNADDVDRKLVNRLFARGREILNSPRVYAPIFADPESVEPPSDMELAELKKNFHSAFNLDPADQTFTVLRDAGFSPYLERQVIGLVEDLLKKGIVAEKSVLLEKPAAGIIVRHINSGQEDKVPDAGAFPSLEEAQRQLKEKLGQLEDGYGMDQVNALGALARAFLVPNLVINRQETNKRADEAANAVGQVFFKVKRGEMIIREGEIVDELARLKLEELARQADQSWMPQASGFFFLALILMTVSWLAGYSIFRAVRLKERDLLFVTLLMALNIFMAYAFYQVGDAMGHGWPGVSKDMVLFLAPLPGGAMLATIFLGAVPGIFFAIVGSGLCALVFDSSLTMFLYMFLGALTGLAKVIRVRERSQITKAGLLIALVNVLAIGAISLIYRNDSASHMLFNLGAGFLCGVLSAVLVTGLIPLFEMVFRYTTNIKLLELANLDRPILRELMVQAPGTYHHSVIVGAMVEAAAETIGANPLLAKVSAYYHDLGKMKKPLYFVENQFTGENKHEKLAPSMSGLILTSHVKDGVELASKHKLSPEIIDIIQQHHGTSLIAYFYQKAKNGRTEDQPEINIEDYRYPGPKPQTREAGLVMLADSVEAASRSLGEPTPSRVQGLVQKLINNIFSDGQLDECELTLKDLHNIAKSFNKILTGIFHRRISYPEPATKDRTSHGSNGKQSAKNQTDSDRTDTGQRKEDLRRLGCS